MNFEIIDKITEDPLFCYEISTDVLHLYRRYDEFLFAEKDITDFIKTLDHTKFVETKSIKLFREKWVESPHQQGDLIQIEVPLLTAQKKYEHFRIRGVYDKKRNTIVGMIRNIEIGIRAVTDHLTGLFNRSGMEQKTLRILNNTGRHSWSVLYLIDLDNFKEVNDTMGHLLGDALLKEVADVLSDVFSEKSLVGRIGGDEFLVLSYDISSSAEISAAADNVITKLSRAFENKNYGVTSSIGISVAKDPTAYNTLFTQADAALYTAKSAGKNCYRFFSPDLKNSRYTNGRSVGNGLNGTIVQDSSFTKYHIMMDEAIGIINQRFTPKDTVIAMSKLIVTSFDVTRAFTSCYMPDGNSVGKSYFYAVNSTENIPRHMPVRRDDVLSNFDEEDIWFCTDVTKVNEPIRTQLIKMQVESFIQFLLRDNDGVVIGILGVNNCGEKRLWMQDEIDILHSIAKLITPTAIALQEECKRELGSKTTTA